MTSLPPDPYRILGVSKDAQIAEIRSAHRKLVLKCHPDKIQDPALKEAKQQEFQQVQQAYELLSNDAEREKYDRKVEAYNERAREKERAKNAAARSPSLTRGTPKRDPVYYHVKEASPRASTFNKSSPYGRTPPRSWEDTTAPRMYEEPTRYARKTASYEKEKPSKREEDRRRRKEDDDWAREKEKEKTRERERADRKARERKEEKERLLREEREKERRRDEKKRSHTEREKERDKNMKNASSEKLRARHPIIETSESSDSSDDDVIYEPPPSKTDRKKSTSGRKVEDIDPSAAAARERKYSGTMEQAIQYLTRSGAKAPAAFVRAQTFSDGTSKAFTPMVPTPPPASAAPFAPPPPPVAEPGETSDEELVKRSSARPSRRMSHDTPRSSRDKPSSHKKSSSSRDQPIILEAGSPSARVIPTLQKSHSERIPSHTDRAPPLPRSHTESFARPIPVPLGRAETWYPSTERERERHERSRSRATPLYSEEEDSEAERERRHRRSRRTHSPEPIVMPAQAHQRYAVDGMKTIPVRSKTYHEQPTKQRMYKQGAAYVVPNSSSRRDRHTAAYARYEYEEEPPQHFPKVKYSPQFDERNIQYSQLPYSGSHRSDGLFVN